MLKRKIDFPSKNKKKCKTTIWSIDKVNLIVINLKIICFMFKTDRLLFSYPACVLWGSLITFQWVSRLDDVSVVCNFDVSRRTKWIQTSVALQSCEGGADDLDWLFGIGRAQFGFLCLCEQHIGLMVVLISLFMRTCITFQLGTALHKPLNNKNLIVASVPRLVLPDVLSFPSAASSLLFHSDPTNKVPLSSSKHFAAV